MRIVEIVRRLNGVDFGSDVVESGTDGRNHGGYINCSSFGRLVQLFSPDQLIKAVDEATGKEYCFVYKDYSTSKSATPYRISNLREILEDKSAFFGDEFYLRCIVSDDGVQKNYVGIKKYPNRIYFEGKGVDKGFEMYSSNQNVNLDGMMVLYEGRVDEMHVSLKSEVAGKKFYMIEIGKKLIPSKSSGSTKSVLCVEEIRGQCYVYFLKQNECREYEW